MTPDQLEAAARWIYGDPVYRGRPAWQSALARGLGLDPRTMRRWAAGTHEPDPQAAGIIRAGVAAADDLRMWDEPQDRLIIDRLAEVLERR